MKTNATDKHVGTRVRMRRRTIGMSREKLGDALGLTYHQVQKYETGKSVITAGRLHEIATILGVPVTFFFEGAPHGSDTTGELPSYVSEFLTTSEGLALTQALMKVSDAKSGDPL